MQSGSKQMLEALTLLLKQRLDIVSRAGCGARILTGRSGLSSPLWSLLDLHSARLPSLVFTDLCVMDRTSFIWFLNSADACGAPDLRAFQTLTLSLRSFALNLCRISSFTAVGRPSRQGFQIRSCCRMFLTAANTLIYEHTRPGHG